MAAIYGNAALTIIAAAGDDPSHGLPGVGVNREVPFNETLVGPVYLRHEWDGVEDVLQSKWASRGWTLQETYLSKKCLLFTMKEVIFACNTELICEYSRVKHQRQLGITGVVFGPGFATELDEDKAPIRLIEAYSKRQLGRQDDALKAISGMLHTLTKPGSKYARLWCILYERPEQPSCYLKLLWKSTQRGDRRADFPSWSPLGRTSHIDFVESVY